MRPAILAAGAAALVLAACDDSQPDRAQPTTAIAVRSAQQEKLHKFNDLHRAIALKRAIYDSGYVCQRITQSGFVGAYQNLDMWMASCADGRDWAIFTGPDGSAQVRDCADVEGFGLPRCAIKAGDEAAGSAG